MALGLIQPLANEYHEYFLGGGEGGGVNAAGAWG